jgi:nitroimidazol reductase NimA-like FMN-containing flavoprotein (pyridoxamine 5'-phosphate oxidase superfamily)
MGMVDVRGAWTEAEVADFLESTTVPIRLATRRPDGSPWIVTLWYRYRDGAFECATGADADVVRFLRSTPDVGLDVSTNDVPYRGVRGHGEVTVVPEDGQSVLRDLVERYLGGTDSSLAQWLLDEDREEVCLRIQPEELYSWDYGDRMADVAAK